MSLNKPPKGYYVVCIIFILNILESFLNVDGNTLKLIDLGFYYTYVSDVGLALCKAYIHTISMYGLINNTSWGIISTTLISFYTMIISLRDLIEYGDTIFAISTIAFFAVFAYLVSVISEIIKEMIRE